MPAPERWAADANGNNYLTSVSFCAECPPVVKASRRYDGAEGRGNFVRLSRAADGDIVKCDVVNDPARIH